MKKFFEVVLVLLVVFTWGFTVYAEKDYLPNTEFTTQIASIGNELCSAPGPWPVPDND